MLASNVGLVDARKSKAISGFRVGRLRISEMPIRHFADWDAKVTLLRDDGLYVGIDCPFAPADMARLFVHVFEGARSNPQTLVSHATSILNPMPCNGPAGRQ